MITLEQYVGPHSKSPDWNEKRKSNAANLLVAVNGLMGVAKDEITFKVNPKTGSQISGEANGGFREQSCPIGAPSSSHKEGLGVDLYDPDGEIDSWCMKNLGWLSSYNIYIEHPDSTPGWSHWTIRAPKSGNRVFRP